MPKPVEFHDAFARVLADVSPRVLTLDECDSTMDEARALAEGGAAAGTVVVADVQRRGRGRVDRTWTSAPGLGLHATWIARPREPAERWTLIPLVTGVAATAAIRARALVESGLKWPNDLMVGDKKLGGILVEADVPSFVLVGLGINVSNTSFPAELPAATSLALEGAKRLDRADLLARTMQGFEELMRDPDAALGRYREICVTLGRRVRVETPRDPVEGIAVDVDARGALVVDTGGSTTAVAAGDVVHVR
ncbi:MAG: biotin--[acetyl-CoA-carboxylase] ligase [Actinomycetota bacterium]